MRELGIHYLNTAEGVVIFYKYACKYPMFSKQSHNEILAVFGVVQDRKHVKRIFLNIITSIQFLTNMNK